MRIEKNIIYFFILLFFCHSLYAHDNQGGIHVHSGVDRASQCHTHASENPRGHDARRWWSRAFFRHFVKHYYRGSNHCETDTNQPPQASALGLMEVRSGFNGTLNASASSDSDGSIASVLWEQLSGPVVTIDNIAAVTTTYVAPAVSNDTPLSFLVTVTDDDGASNSARLNVIIKPAPAEPSVSISGGGEFNYAPNTNIELVANVDDPDSTEFTYVWRQLSGPQAEIVSGASQARLTITLPVVTVTETLSFSVQVTDPDRLNDSANIAVIVNPPAAPADINSLSVRITDTAGSGLSDVALQVFNEGVDTAITAQTDADGFASVDLLTETAYAINLRKDGFVTQVINVNALEMVGDIRLRESLSARDLPLTISENGSATQNGNDGTSVTLDKNDFVDTNGQVVSGSIELSITPIDVTKASASAAFSTSTFGVAQGETEISSLYTMGIAEFVFSQNGEVLDLVNGSTADIVLPLYTDINFDGSQIEIGQAIPFWSLNETTGVWQQEGVGQVVSAAGSPTGLGLVATVTHFSIYSVGNNRSRGTLGVTVSGFQSGVARVQGIFSGFGICGEDTRYSWSSFPHFLGFTEIRQLNGTGDFILADVPSGGSSDICVWQTNICVWAELEYELGGTARTSTQCRNYQFPGQFHSIELNAFTEGPLDVQVSPSISDDLSVIRTLQEPAFEFSISPLTIETQVNYVVLSGNLPEGLSLNVRNNNATLIGIATTPGTWDFVIRATDSDGFTDDITVSYTVVGPNASNDELDMGAWMGSTNDGGYDILAPFLPNPDVVYARGYVGSMGLYSSNSSGDALIVRPISEEVDMRYQIVEGALPPGMLANTSTICCVINGGIPYLALTYVDFNGISAPPTAAGNYSFVVEGVDAEGGVDRVEFNIVILDELPPPLLSPFGGSLQADAAGNFTGNLRDGSILFNGGGSIDSLEIITDISDPFFQNCLKSSQNRSTSDLLRPFPAAVNIDFATGDIDINNINTGFWENCFKATNASGSSAVALGIRAF